MELRMRLEELEKKRMFWMHGERDVRVSLEDGFAIASLFDAAGWAIEMIEHKKGHMIPNEHHESLQEWLATFTDSS